MNNFADEIIQGATTKLINKAYEEIFEAQPTLIARIEKN